MTNNTSKIGAAQHAMTAIFFVLCGLSILQSLQSIEMSKLGGTSIAPENLRRAGESFQIGLAVDLKDMPDYTATRSWRELNEELDAYATRLELHTTHQRRMQFIIMIAYMVSGFGMAGLSIVSANQRTKTEVSNPRGKIVL